MGQVALSKDMGLTWRPRYVMRMGAPLPPPFPVRTPMPVCLTSKPINVVAFQPGTWCPYPLSAFPGGNSL